SALCVVRMAASWLKNDKPTQDGKIFVAIKKAYAKTLNKCLNHKWVVIVLVITLFGVSALGATTLGMEFFTTADEGGLTISVEIDTATLSTMNVGVSKSSEDYYTYDMAVEETVAIIESVLTSYDEVETIGIAYSSGMTVSGITIGDTTITATVGLCDYRDRDDSTVEIIADITSALAMKSNSLFTFSIVENTAMDTVSTFVNDDITLSYYSDDITTLTTTGSDLTALISEIPGVTSVSDGSSSDDQQYYIVIDKAKASEYGLTVATAYLQIASLITAPSSSTSITIDSIELADETEDYAVYILDTSYTGLAWYRAYNSTGTDYTRIYFENNLGDIGVDADYYALNNGKSSIFVKHNGEIVEVAVGDYIPLTYIDGAFTYEYAVVTEYVDTNDAGENVTLHEVSYETVSYTVSDYTTYSTYFTDDIDLVMLEMVTEDLFGTEGFEAEPFYLYEILSDESFVKDADGNIVYRTSSTTEQIPSDIALIDGYSSIYREDGQRMGTITITYDTLNYTSDEINAAINTILDEYELTSHGDLVIDRDTSNAIMTEVFNTLYLVLGLAIVLIYLVMVAQFQSLKSPFIIMFTIPLAFTGSLALLYILGFEMSILALLGLIVLMGIVVNNGIVFVDYANKLIENGTPKREALIRTGIDRIRPILMTALTTIMAMLVMAVDTSIQGIMLQPLAIGVIGGLAYATLLTLFFVPIIYDLFNRKEKDLTRINALKSDEMEEAALEEGEDKLMPTEQAIVDGVLLAQSDYASKIATQKAKKDKKKNKYKQIKLEAKREKVLQKILDSRED
ncbi:MAG: efflux RND transporter permease subunit, partial [Bacillota bacterium]